MNKLTIALSAATALTAATIGLAAPAIAAASAAQDTVSSVGANHSIQPVDACSVHVLYQGSVVDVQWC